VAAAAMLAGVGALAGGGAAFASLGPGPVAPKAPLSGGGGPQPPWESSVSPNGFIGLWSAQGQMITGGSTSSGGLGAYAVASTAASSTSYTKATVFAYTPVKGQDPSTWSGEEISLSTNFPNSAAPVPVGTTANPVTTTPDGQVTLANYIANFPNTNTDPAWQNLYDLRMKVSGLGIPLSTTYWDLVISVNTTNNTWSIDWPDWTQPTTTALAASPPSPQTSPASPITLTATVTPATAGTVTFWSGTTQIGVAQTVTGSNGVATASMTPTPPMGTTPYTAVYDPAVGSADGTGKIIIGSASTLSYVVNAQAQPPAFEPTLVGPGGPNTARVDGKEFCVASFSNSPTVTYAWQANGVTISGQTTATFSPPAPLLGQSLTCSVKASNSGGSVSGTSPGVTVAIGAPLVPTVKPKISGPHVVGGIEKVTAGTWSPAATKVTFQWFIGSTKVAGATKATFRVPRRALHKKVHCVVTASAPGHLNGVFKTPGVKIT